MKELEAKIQLARSRFDKAKKRLEFLLETKTAVETEIVVSARNVLYSDTTSTMREFGTL